MLGALVALANLVPLAGGLFKQKSTAGRIAETISSVAQAVTKTDSDDKALAALEGSPELLLKYTETVNQQVIRIHEEETERLRIANATMQNESANADPYVRRMRPTYGYTMSFATLMLVLIAGWAVVWKPSTLPLFTELVEALAPVFEIGLSVLGLYVWKRSGDKRGPQPSALESVVDAVRQIRK